MKPTSTSRVIRIIAAVLTGGIALTGYAGMVGLIGGGLSFGPVIDARLPFQSLVLAGLALLVFVAVPMTIAALAAQHDHRLCGDLVFASGLLLVIWIALELAFIQTYSWFHPTYLTAAVVVLGLGWLVNRWPSRPARSARGGERVSERRSVSPQLIESRLGSTAEPRRR